MKNCAIKLKAYLQTFKLFKLTRQIHNHASALASIIKARFQQTNLYIIAYFKQTRIYIYVCRLRRCVFRLRRRWSRAMLRVALGILLVWQVISGSTIFDTHLIDQIHAKIASSRFGYIVYTNTILRTLAVWVNKLKFRSRYCWYIWSGLFWTSTQPPTLDKLNSGYPITWLNAVDICDLVYQNNNFFRICSERRRGIEKQFANDLPYFLQSADFQTTYDFSIPATLFNEFEAYYYTLILNCLSIELKRDPLVFVRFAVDVRFRDVFFQQITREYAALIRCKLNEFACLYTETQPIPADPRLLISTDPVVTVATWTSYNQSFLGTVYELAYSLGIEHFFFFYILLPIERSPFFPYTEIISVYQVFWPVSIFTTAYPYAFGLFLLSSYVYFEECMINMYSEDWLYYYTNRYWRARFFVLDWFRIDFDEDWDYIAVFLALGLCPLFFQKWLFQPQIGSLKGLLLCEESQVHVGLAAADMFHDSPVLLLAETYELQNAIGQGGVTSRILFRQELGRRWRLYDVYQAGFNLYQLSDSHRLYDRSAALINICDTLVKFRRDSLGKTADDERILLGMFSGHRILLHQMGGRRALRPLTLPEFMQLEAGDGFFETVDEYQIKRDKVRLFINDVMRYTNLFEVQSHKQPSVHELISAQMRGLPIQRLRICRDFISTRTRDTVSTFVPVPWSRSQYFRYAEQILTYIAQQPEVSPELAQLRCLCNLQVGEVSDVDRVEHAVNLEQYAQACALLRLDDHRMSRVYGALSRQLDLCKKLISNRAELELRRERGGLFAPYTNCVVDSLRPQIQTQQYTLRDIASMLVGDFVSSLLHILDPANDNLATDPRQDYIFTYEELYDQMKVTPKLVLLELLNNDWYDFKLKIDPELDLEVATSKHVVLLRDRFRASQARGSSIAYRVFESLPAKAAQRLEKSREKLPYALPAIYDAVDMTLDSNACYELWRTDNDIDFAFTDDYRGFRTYSVVFDDIMNYKPNTRSRAYRNNIAFMNQYRHAARAIPYKSVSAEQSALGLEYRLALIDRFEYVSLRAVLRRLNRCRRLRRPVRHPFNALSRDEYRTIFQYEKYNLDSQFAYQGMLDQEILQYIQSRGIYHPDVFQLAFEVAQRRLGETDPIIESLKRLIASGHVYDAYIELDQHVTTEIDRKFAQFGVSVEKFSQFSFPEFKAFLDYHRLPTWYFALSKTEQQLFLKSDAALYSSVTYFMKRNQPILSLLITSQESMNPPQFDKLPLACRLKPQTKHCLVEFAIKAFRSMPDPRLKNFADTLAVLPIDKAFVVINRLILDSQTHARALVSSMVMAEWQRCDDPVRKRQLSDVLDELDEKKQNTNNDHESANNQKARQLRWSDPYGEYVRKIRLGLFDSWLEQPVYHLSANSSINTHAIGEIVLALNMLLTDYAPDWLRGELAYFFSVPVYERPEFTRGTMRNCLKSIRESAARVRNESPLQQQLQIDILTQVMKFVEYNTFLNRLDSMLPRFFVGITAQPHERELLKLINVHVQDPEIQAELMSIDQAEAELSSDQIDSSAALAVSGVDSDHIRYDRSLFTIEFVGTRTLREEYAGMHLRAGVVYAPFTREELVMFVTKMQSVFSVPYRLSPQTVNNDDVLKYYGIESTALDEQLRKLSLVYGGDGLIPVPGLATCPPYKYFRSRHVSYRNKRKSRRRWMPDILRLSKPAKIKRPKSYEAPDPYAFHSIFPTYDESMFMQMRADIVEQTTFINREKRVLAPIGKFSRAMVRNVLSDTLTRPLGSGGLDERLLQERAKRGQRRYGGGTNSTRERIRRRTRFVNGYTHPRRIRRRRSRPYYMCDRMQRDPNPYLRARNGDSLYDAYINEYSRTALPQIRDNCRTRYQNLYFQCIANTLRSRTDLLLWDYACVEPMREVIQVRDPTVEQIEKGLVKKTYSEAYKLLQAGKVFDRFYANDLKERVWHSKPVFLELGSIYHETSLLGPVTSVNNKYDLAKIRFIPDRYGRLFKSVIDFAPEASRVYESASNIAAVEHAAVSGADMKSIVASNIQPIDAYKTVSALYKRFVQNPRLRYRISVIRQLLSRSAWMPEITDELLVRICRAKDNILLEDIITICTALDNTHFAMLHRSESDFNKFFLTLRESAIFTDIDLQRIQDREFYDFEVLAELAKTDYTLREKVVRLRRVLRYEYNTRVAMFEQLFRQPSIRHELELTRREVVRAMRTDQVTYASGLDVRTRRMMAVPVVPRFVLEEQLERDLKILISAGMSDTEILRRCAHRQSALYNMFFHDHFAEQHRPACMGRYYLRQGGTSNFGEPLAVYSYFKHEPDRYIRNLLFVVRLFTRRATSPKQSPTLLERLVKKMHDFWVDLRCEFDAVVLRRPQIDKTAIEFGREHPDLSLALLKEHANDKYSLELSAPPEEVVNANDGSGQVVRSESEDEALTRIEAELNQQILDADEALRYTCDAWGRYTLRSEYDRLSYAESFSFDRRRIQNNAGRRPLSYTVEQLTRRFRHEGRRTRLSKKRSRFEHGRYSVYMRKSSDDGRVSLQTVLDELLITGFYSVTAPKLANRYYQHLLTTDISLVTGQESVGLWLTWSYGKYMLHWFPVYDEDMHKLLIAERGFVFPPHMSWYISKRRTLTRSWQLLPDNRIVPFMKHGTTYEFVRRLPNSASLEIWVHFFIYDTFGMVPGDLFYDVLFTFIFYHVALWSSVFS